MAIITDKLEEKKTDPLLDKSEAQLQKEIDDRMWALKEKQRLAAEAKRAALLDEASSRMEATVDNLKWLETNGFLSDKVKASYTTSGGVFAPHLSFKKPR